MAAKQLDPKLLEILRCPVAVHYTDKGDDPGKLRLERDYWLVCDDSGYKYPIIDGIPKMLVEEGARWKDTAVEDLPVPPPNDPIPTSSDEDSEAASALRQQADSVRLQVVKQLNAAAETIRKEASEADGKGAPRSASEVANSLERAAHYINTHSVEQIGEAAADAARGLPWRTIGMAFIAGLLGGMILRRK